MCTIHCYTSWYLHEQMLIFTDFSKLNVSGIDMYAERMIGANQSLIQFIISNLKMKEKELPTYVKRYCCLYHFTSGKLHKDSSPCFNHVPLGIINPEPSTFARRPKAPPQNIKVTSQQYDINFHTHDLNEIQNKESLPKRLAYPRVYVQQLRHKNYQERDNVIAGYQAFLKGKQFQEIFDLFKVFAKKTQFTSQQELIRSIRSFAIKNFILFRNDKNPALRDQVLFSHENFINFMTQLGFQLHFSQQFWKVAYNKSRFSEITQKPPIKTAIKTEQVISMIAFAFNFKKFYLEQLLSYKNCLSQSALRQRMIDLRLFLEPWFNKNIILKQNSLNWKKIEFQICAQLKRYQQQRLYITLITMIEMRNKIWLFMRTLSKIIFIVTDQKNVGLEVFNQKATELIDRNRINLDIFVDFINHFQNKLLQRGMSKDQKFKITDLVLQAKTPKFVNRMEEITHSLRGLFKYLYFFNENPSLQLNHQTLNLDCSTILEVSFNQLIQYLSFKRKETNHLMDMIQSVCKEVNDVVDARPEITGHKRFVNQCNFVAQSLLKMIRRCDFDVFYRLQRARELFMRGDIADVQRLKEIIESSDKIDLSTRSQFWKKMFSFQMNQQEMSQSIQSQNQSQRTKDKNYVIALEDYRRLRDKLEGKLPSFEESKNQLKIEKKPRKSSNKERGNQVNAVKTEKEQSENVKITESIIEVKHKCGTSAYCSLCDQVCNTTVTSELHKIDEMSSYLMDLLGFP